MLPKNARFTSHVLISLLLVGCQPASLMPQVGAPTGSSPVQGALPGSVGVPGDATAEPGQLPNRLADSVRPVSVTVTFPMEALGNLQSELNKGRKGNDLTPESLDNLSVLIDGRQVDVRRLDFTKPTINPDGTITTTMTVFELTPEEADEILTAQAEAIVDAEEALESTGGMSIQATTKTQAAVATAKTQLQQAQTQPTSRTRAVTTTTTTTTAKPTPAPTKTPGAAPTTTATPAPTKTPGAAPTATATPAPATRPTPVPTNPTAVPPASLPTFISAAQLQAMTLQDLRTKQAYFETQVTKVPQTIQTLQTDLRRNTMADSDKAAMQSRIQSLQRLVDQAKATLDAISPVLTGKAEAARREAPPAAQTLATSAQSLKVQTPNEKVVMQTAVQPRPSGTTQPPAVAVSMTTTAAALITQQLQAEQKPTVKPDPQLVDLVAKRLTQASGSAGGTPMLQQPVVVAAVQTATKAAITNTPVTALAPNTALVPSGGGGGGGGGGTTVVPAPTLTTVSPAFGPIAGGTTVTLTGTNFTGATGVTFGGVAGTALTVNSATSITVTTPATTVGAKDVVVTTPGGSVTLTSGFNYLSGAVTTLAGSTQGDTDGTGTAAQFNFAVGIAVDSAGNAYVADQATDKIRKITPAGVVTTFAGGTQGNADGTGTAAQFYDPYAVAVDAADNVYVADTLNQRIRKITPAGVVTTLAGSTQGFADGTGTAAQFHDPQGVAVDAAGNVYVADSGNQRIRKITPAGDVTTLAGQAVGGFADGTGSAAQFNFPFGIAVDSSGNVYAADFHNSKIRKITQAGVVTTFAGSTHGLADGTGTAAQFGNLYGMSIDPSGNLYVVDRTNHLIRKITPAAVVTTLAGSTQGDADGTSTTVQFNQPWGVAVGSNGIVYVADTYNFKIRKIQ